MIEIEVTIRVKRGDEVLFEADARDHRPEEYLRSCDALFRLRVPGLGREAIAKMYAVAEEHEATDGSPFTVWSQVNAATRLSQETGYADKRQTLDVAAGKIMALAK